ncbi:MAG: hypothetical protein GTN38_03765 [Candidatus Aenigmarchaeota archaeon]|nr:hypothetical protein [Candidatus Aenigmarchaeota archaeon]NIP40779.1 hypothetical protein [Candidatus Aenigmarchaeota archaeon]NIQ17369.1 hypothetical protein [Candidatus Aenigmarchaeota archaeon]NIS73482.1 hypothetical protein [Candidatus Aenigmarchaeota archaeon]
MQYKVKISDDSRTVSIFTDEKVVPDIVKVELAEKHGINMTDYRLSVGPRETGDKNLRWVTIFTKR